MVRLKNSVEGKGLYNVSGKGGIKGFKGKDIEGDSGKGLVKRRE